MDLILIKSYRLFSYVLPFKKPVRIKGHALTKRQGLLVQLSDGKSVGWGEAAPLPHFSHETTAQAFKQLQKILPRLITTTQQQGSITAAQDYLESKKNYPSVEFALECALQNLSDNTKRPRQKTPNSNHTTVLAVPLSGLLQGNSREIINEAHRLQNLGVTSFKLKLSNNHQQDIQLLHKLDRSLKPGIGLRLDANQRLNFSEAVTLISRSPRHRIDYIEEPFRNLQIAEKLFQATQTPYALDESLSKISYNVLPKLKGLKALILKPTLLGGSKNLRHWVTWGNKLKLQIIFSACFESSLGLNRIIGYILKLLKQPVPQGLDTYKYFKHELTSYPLTIKNGNLISAPTINHIEVITPNFIKDVTYEPNYSLPAC